MVGVRVEIEAAAALGRLRAAGEQVDDLTELMGWVGDYLIGSTQARFDAGKRPDGNLWPDSWRVKAGGKTLYHTGKLRDEIDKEVDARSVRVGSSEIYAAIHQFGGTITPKNGSALVFKIGDRTIFAKSVTIPARPFLGIDEADEVEIQGLAEDFLALAFGGLADAV